MNNDQREPKTLIPSTGGGSRSKGGGAQAPPLSSSFFPPAVSAHAAGFRLRTGKTPLRALRKRKPDAASGYLPLLRTHLDFPRPCLISVKGKTALRLTKKEPWPRILLFPRGNGFPFPFPFHDHEHDHSYSYSYYVPVPLFTIHSSIPAPSLPPSSDFNLSVLPPSAARPVWVKS